MIRTLWTQSTGIRRLTKKDALEDAKWLKDDIDGLNHNHKAEIRPSARKVNCGYIGYVTIKDKTE